MSFRYTDAQFNEEYRRYNCSSIVELCSVRNALSVMACMNTPQESARLAAVKRIIFERKIGSAS